MNVFKQVLFSLTIILLFMASIASAMPQSRNSWSYAGDSIPTPFSPSWSEATLDQKSAISYIDSNRWETKLTTNHNQSDYQMYRFYVAQPVSNITNLTATWTGYGEAQANYDTYLYVWNNNNNLWEQLDTKHLSSDGTLNGTKATNISSYIDSNGYLYLASGARHYNYPPPTPSGLTASPGAADVTISWNPVVDQDGDDVQYNVIIVGGYGSSSCGGMWINTTSCYFWGLNPGYSFSYQVKARDTFANAESSVATGSFSTIAVALAPVSVATPHSLNTNYVELKINNQITGNIISNPNNISTSSGSFISWDNDVSSDNRLYYGLNQTDVNNLVNGNWSLWNNNSIRANIRISGLAANTTYYYRPQSWYLGTSVTSNVVSFTTLKPGVWLSPSEYMVSPAGWAGSPSNFRTINISATPLDGNGRYISGLSLQAVIYNSTGGEIGRTNLSGNGPYYKTFMLPDYLDEGGYIVKIAGYQLAGDFSVLKWSCANCHTNNYPSTFNVSTVHPRHLDTTNISGLNVYHCSCCVA